MRASRKLFAKTLTVTAAVVAGVLSAPVAATAAEKTVTSVDKPTPIRSWKGIGAFSVYDKDQDVYRLAVTRLGGKPELLPVAPRAVPSDADIGPDTRNEPAIVYSRCELEIGEMGRGPKDCDIYRYSLTRRVESRITNADSDAASEFNPTIWDGRVAWVRTYDRREGDTPYVYTRELTAPRSQRSRRMPGVPARRCSRVDRDACGPTRDRSVDELELYGRWLALNVRYFYDGSGGICGEKEIRLDALRGVGAFGDKAQRVASTLCGLGGQSFIGLSFDEGRLYWAKFCAGDPDGCSPRNAGVFRYRLSQGSWSRAGHDRPLTGFSYVDDDRAYEVRATCDAIPDTPPHACPVVLTEPLTFDATWTP